MKLFRKAIFWTHLCIGVIGGIIILLMSFTGVLLMYEKQITHWADTRNYRATGDARLPLETLLARVQQSQNGATINSVTMWAEPSKPVAIGFAGQGGGRTLFVNPYTGDVFGEGAKGVREFFHVMTDWHRWIGASGENRATARAITGACNLGFLFIVASGIYLWWPNKQTWQQFKNIMWFRRGLPGKARDFNWHNVIGFWSFVPLFIVVLSAVVISYPWASNLVYRVVGENPPQQQRPPAGPPNAGGGNKAPISFEGLNQRWDRAAQFSPGWQSLSLRLPAQADAPLPFTIDHGMGGQPQKRATLTLDRKTGEVTRWEGFSGFTPGRQLRSILRFAHTGEVLGFIGQTIAGLVSLGACFLVYTGLALSWRRFWAWRDRRTRRAAENAPQVVNAQ